jgi:hypothetical protein
MVGPERHAHPGLPRIDVGDLDGHEREEHEHRERREPAPVLLEERERALLERGLLHARRGG